MDVQTTFADEAARLKEACAPGVHLRILRTECSMDEAQLRAVAHVQQQTGMVVNVFSTMLARLGGQEVWLVYMREPARLPYMREPARTQG
jgi:hypothetical protein